MDRNYKEKMSALRFLLLIAIIGCNVRAFAFLKTDCGAETLICEQSDLSFHDNYYRFVSVGDLITPSLLTRYFPKKKKLDYLKNLHSITLSALCRNNVRFLYIGYSKTIDLKLVSFSISHPFNFFP